MSRPKERIDIFFNAIEGRILEVLEDVLKLGSRDQCAIYSLAVTTNLAEIESYWKENPDQRFGQVLVNLGIIPNLPGFWYYIEEIEIFEALGVPAREYLLWGQNYDKDMNLLPQTIRKPIKDLNTDHIKAILGGKWVVGGHYQKCFEEELKLRGGG